MPIGFEIYVVQPGDTIDTIAIKYGVDVNHQNDYSQPKGMPAYL